MRHNLIAQSQPAFLGLLALRLTDRVIEEGARVARDRGIKTPPKCMSTMIILAAGPAPASELAAGLGVSHVAVLKNVKELDRLGFVCRSRDPKDARRRPVELTSKGHKEARRIQLFVQSIKTTYLSIFEETGSDTHAALQDLEGALNRRSFFDRLDHETPPAEWFTKNEVTEAI